MINVSRYTLIASCSYLGILKSTPALNLYTSGNRSITFVIGGNNQGVISATIGQTQRSHFTVPKGFRLFLIGFEANSTSNAEFEVHLMSKTFGESWLVRNRTFLNNEHVVSNITGIVLNEKTEIRFHAKSSSANKPLSVHYTGILVKIHS